MLTYGFIDTLSIIRKETCREGKNLCTFSGLADALNIWKIGAHNAVNDCAFSIKYWKN